MDKRISLEECPDENIVSAFCSGRLDPEERAEVESHVELCRACRACLAAVARIDALGPFTSIGLEEAGFPGGTLQKKDPK
jgi:anti-sigma factor RsiW